MKHLAPSSHVNSYDFWLINALNFGKREALLGGGQFPGNVVSWVDGHQKHDIQKFKGLILTNE